jgi:hypothetical protein
VVEALAPNVGTGLRIPNGSVTTGGEALLTTVPENAELPVALAVPAERIRVAVTFDDPVTEIAGTAFELTSTPPPVTVTFDDPVTVSAAPAVAVTQRPHGSTGGGV